MALQCYGLPPAPTALCESNTYLCTVCPRTCQFCNASASSGPCEDRIPWRSCREHRRTELHGGGGAASAVQPRLFASTGLCDSVLPSAWPMNGTWSHSGAGPRAGLRFSLNAGSGLADEQNAGRVRACYASKTIVFMGDSNVRYQYLALAKFLARGAWPDASAGDSTDGSNFTLCSETTAPPTPPALAANMSVGELARDRWRSFYAASSAALDGHEVCECDILHKVENRLFEVTRHGLTTRLAFFPLKGLPVVSGVKDWSGGFEAVRERIRAACAEGACPGHGPRVRPGWHGDRMVALGALGHVLERVRHLKPDVLLVGPGPWERPRLGEPSDMGKLHEFMAAAKRALAPGGRVLFRSCPRGATRPSVTRVLMGFEDVRGCDNSDYCDEPWRALLFAGASRAPWAGWELFDVFRYTEALWTYVDAGVGASRLSRAERRWPFIDGHHFQCEVYREINLLLVAQLCPRARPEHGVPPDRNRTTRAASRSRVVLKEVEHL